MVTAVRIWRLARGVGGGAGGTAAETSYFLSCFYVEDAGSTLFGDADTFLPPYTASYLGKFFFRQSPSFPGRALNVLIMSCKRGFWKEKCYLELVSRGISYMK